MDISMLSWFFSDPLPPGTRAPDFDLPDQQGQRVSLAGLRGKNVILVFYPGDDTSRLHEAALQFSRSVDGGIGQKRGHIWRQSAERGQAHQIPRPVQVSSSRFWWTRSSVWPSSTNARA